MMPLKSSCAPRGVDAGAGRRLLFFLAALSLLFSGCAYHVAGKAGKMPGGITRLSIPMFTNSTRKPDIEAVLTNTFINEFITTVTVVSDADAVMQGNIIGYDIKTASYTGADVTQEYRLTVVYSIRIYLASDGTTLWEDGNITDYEDYKVNPNDVSATKEAEAVAFLKISKDTSRLIKERMLDNF